MQDRAQVLRVLWEAQLADWIESQDLARLEAELTRVQSQRENKKRQQEGLGVFDSFAAPSIREYLDVHNTLPKAWHSILDDQLRVVWRFENCLVSRLIGVQCATRIAKVLYGSMFQSMIQLSLVIFAGVGVLLATLEIVPTWVGIMCTTISMFITLTTVTLFSDMKIVWHVCVTLENVTQIAVALLVAVSFHMLTNGDHRNFAVPIYPLISFAIVLMEACCTRIRTLGSFILAATAIIFLVFWALLNAGLVPHVWPNTVFLTIEWVPNMSFQFSALGVYNQAILAQVILLLRSALTYVSIFWRGSHALKNACVQLEGIDDPESNDTAILAHLESFIRSRRT